jgi:hypothetical protein
MCGASPATSGTASPPSVRRVGPLIGPRPKDGWRCPSTSWAAIASPGLAPCALPSPAGCPRASKSWHGAVSPWRPARSCLSWSALTHARSVAAPLRLQRVPKPQGRGILALAGRQPDVGPEGLWGWRDWLAAAVLLARSLLSATQEDWADLRREGKRALGGPSVGGLADGQASLRGAVAKALPEGPHPLGHFPSLREAAHPVYAADRHAKKARKQRVRGVRPMARPWDKRPEPAAEVRRGSCSAVRRALTDEGHPPRAAAGRKRHERLTALSQRRERGTKRGRGPRRSAGCKPSSHEACPRPPLCGPRGGWPLAGSSGRLLSALTRTNTPGGPSHVV